MWVAPMKGMITSNLELFRLYACGDVTYSDSRIEKRGPVWYVFPSKFYQLELRYILSRDILSIGVCPRLVMLENPFTAFLRCLIAGWLISVISSFSFRLSFYFPFHRILQIISFHLNLSFISLHLHFIAWFLRWSYLWMCPVDDSGVYLYSPSG